MILEENKSYVGKDIAKYIYENNITYEEYYEYFLR